MKKFLNFKVLILFPLSFFIIINLNLPISLANNGNNINSKISNNKYVDGEILVKYKDNINPDTIPDKAKFLNFVESNLLSVKEKIQGTNISILNITDKSSVEDKIAELKNNPNVEFAQPNYQYYSTTIDTNDTYKDLLWGLDNIGQIVNSVTGTNNADINAPEAWSINEGTNSSSPVIVAVIDTGVAYLHPDLISNMWDGLNCKDENGTYIIGGCNHGYDYESNDITPLPDISQPSFYHGTHIAGIIAAVKNNNIGIIGVAPNAKIMAIKSSLTTSNIIKGINFAQQNGAKIINTSWGSISYDSLLKDAIASFPGLLIAAAGNCGDASSYSSHGCTSQNQTFYPAAFDLDNIISVAATDQNDNLASFSNYSSSFIDVGAPGVNILSTVTLSGDGSDEIYGYINGTSMAAPYVAGLAALIEGYKQNLTDAQVKNIILTTGDSLSSLFDKTVSGKRIDAQKALEFITPIKKITNFDLVSLSASGVIDENNHTIIINVPFGTDVTSLIPTIVIDGASVSPNTLISQNFTKPIEYTVTALDDSTQVYTVTVNINPSDAMIVASDNLLLINDSIKGSNPDISNITTPLTNPLPASGSNGSVITWVSSDPSIISNDGQTITRPAFGTGNASVNLTATLTKGEVVDTQIFTLIVLADDVAPTLNSITITTPATKLSYKVGEALDITGLVISGVYSDSRTRIEIITNQNITGFNSSSPSANQVLIVTINDKTTTYTVNIIAQVSNGGGGGGGGGSGSGSGGGGINNINSPSVIYILLAPTVPVTQIEGCNDRNTGFSITTGKSCIGNFVDSSSISETNSINSGPLKYNLGTTILKNGSKGESVKELQRFLNDTLNLGLVLDGKLGPKTIAVIKEWQKNKGLVPDGLVGPKTKAMMK